MEHLHVADSRIAGKGVFAARDIPEGELIGEYTGEIITDEEADRRYENEEMTYLFDIGGGKCIDALRSGCILRYVNHSCDPNCDDRLEGCRVFYYAKRNIRKGEELTIDYELIADEDEACACSCGAANCRGTMKGASDQPSPARA
jgi:SET domain-containing protein